MSCASAASALEIKLMSELLGGHAPPVRLVEVGQVSDIWRRGRIFGSKFKGGNEAAGIQQIGGLQDFGKKSLTLWKCNNGILRTHSSQTKNLVPSCFPSWRPRKIGSLAT